MKPWQAPLNKAPSKGGKEEGRDSREDPSQSHKSKTQTVTMGEKEQIMFQSPHQLQEVYQKGKRNLKEQ
jgi:hypothetical protein